MTYDPNKAVRVKDLIEFAELVKTNWACKCSGSGSGDGGGSGSSGQFTGTGGKFGYRIDKNNSDPATRVEYLFDALGKTPAHMDFENDVFDYGDWANVWFMKENKPLMLRSDGTVDYYLNPDNYDEKEDSTASDVSNTSYDGNAMAQIPLIWIKRYEDENYCYEIISDTQEDEDFKAYAHTRADGTIADYFYWGLFGASGDATKMRSLSGQTRANNINAQGFIDGAQANGTDWYIHTWSQRECIRTLLILIGKSTDTQAIFGTGNCYSESSFSDVKTTGTLKDKGQFYGSSANNQQLKVFHIEAFWGDMSTWIAGVIANEGTIYAKMTPEGDGYRVTDVNGYKNMNITINGGGMVSEVSCSEYGMIPAAFNGSDTTYYCDYSYIACYGMKFLIYKKCLNFADGVFSIDTTYSPSQGRSFIGGGLSCIMPAA